MDSKSIISDLKKIVGENNVEDDELIIKLYGRNAAYVEGNALAVVFPTSVLQVSNLVKYAYKHNLKIYPQGSASELTGASTPYRDGIILSFNRMDRVKEVNIIDSYVVVEPGVRINDLNIVLMKYGYMFPIDPASEKSASVGGAINNGSGGMKGVKYGTMKDWVLELEVVIPNENGTILRLGCKTMKCRSGYDLVRLIIGSEGTLAIVTEATLKITPLPKNIVTIASFFSKLEDLANTVIELKKQGISLFIAEFVDAYTVEAAYKYLKPKIIGKGHMLIVSVDAPLMMADEMLNLLEGIARSNNAVSIFKARTMSDAEELGLFMIRRALLPLSVNIAAEEIKDLGSRPIVIMQDISVPPSKLPYAISELRSLAEKYNISMTLGGHIGDGNIHPMVWYSEKDDNAKKIVNEFIYEMMMIAIKLGGTVSSEHGIGIMKKAGLVAELQSKESLYALDLMKGIKKLFDPKEILNPGKIW
jgi:glycolate oxidase